MEEGNKINTNIFRFLQGNRQQGGSGANVPCYKLGAKHPAFRAFPPAVTWASPRGCRRQSSLCYCKSGQSLPRLRLPVLDEMICGMNS